MAILQALISYLTRSAGKALNAIFGWAVIALFGQTSAKEQMILSAVVAAAAAWPLLLLGVIVPKVALLVLAFVPLAKSVPSLWLRIVWIGLALIVPIVVGIVVAKRGSQEHLPEPGWKKLLRGFPITLALAAAFLLMLVVAPVLRLAAVIRRREVVRVPSLMDRSNTAETMAALAGQLAAHGYSLRKAEAPWHMTAPSRIMLKIGGAAFASMANEHVEFRKSEVLEVAVLANETILRGKPDAVGRAQALAAEVFGPRPIIQTFDAESRELEKQIKRVWSVYREQPRAHRSSAALTARVNDIAGELSTKNLPWDEWQMIYRLLLQLDRALRGDAALLEHAVAKEEPMDEGKLPLPGPRNMERLPERPIAVPVSVEGMTNRELVGHVIESATMLAKKEIELAKTELKRDLKDEVAMAKGLGAGAICALCAVNMLLVTAALALGNVMAEWAAALLVAAAVLAVGVVFGLIGWGKRVKNPLESTRRSLKEDALWAKERLA
ncbi:MAG: phage holin family protein [Myxococcales bacterium]|nr:phage holin family protein [Myxococcales bacterium]